MAGINGNGINNGVISMKMAIGVINNGNGGVSLISLAASAWGGRNGINVWHGIAVIAQNGSYQRNGSCRYISQWRPSSAVSSVMAALNK
jgi:hypothetical protein